MNTNEFSCHHCGKTVIRKKQTKPVLLHFCDNKCKGDYQRTFKPVSRDWLYEHYVTKGLNTTQIAHIVKRDPKSVWNWLKDFGIPTRSRGGTTSPGCFIKGRPSLFEGRKHNEETKKKLSDLAKADGRVPYDPRVGPYGRGRKGHLSTNWKGGITPERQSFYFTDEWKEAAKAVWKRDNATCQRCQVHFGSLSQAERKSLGFAIHHIVSFKSVELRSVVSNLVFLCRPCHLWVHSKKNKNREFLREEP